MEIVIGLNHNSLMSARKFTDEKYITILTEYEVNIYDDKTTNITISEEALVKGWRCKDTWLWRILLKNSVKM